MNKPQRCPNCNGTKIESGSLSSTGKLHFRPEHAKFLKLKTANVDVAANICMDCGHIILMADTDKVKVLHDETRVGSSG
jgi:hypothetical protein